MSHLLEISGNPYKKPAISYALGRNPFEKWEIMVMCCISRCGGYTLSVKKKSVESD